MDAYAIFEGGGAKGLAHVGALAAAEEREIAFKGVAGASAGAIVAALIAGGYRSIDMFDPTSPSDADKIYGADLRRLLKSWKEWGEYENLFKALAELNKKFSWKKALWLLWKYNSIRLDLKLQRGIFSTAHIEAYLDELLEKKLLELNPDLKSDPTFATQRTGVQLRVRFDHLPVPLKIVATDVTNNRMIVFSQQNTSDYPVAKAVGASICLPLVFQPHLLEDHGEHRQSILAVDGGLLSNFPAWLFDEERKNDGPHMPTFGFRLVQKPSPKKLDEMFGLIKGLLTAVLEGDPLLETREIENLHEVPLNVSVSTLDFNLSPDQKLSLFNEGLESARKHFDRPGFPREPQLATATLELIIQTLRDELQLGGDPLIRANIVCMTTRGTLRVTYSCFMQSDDDTDDRLEFRIGEGACGRCWVTKEPNLCDLVQARSEFRGKWKMDKYQQALVRTDLASLAAYPILNDRGDRLGILNIDSPDRELLSVLRDERAHLVLEEGARGLVDLLQPHRSAAARPDIRMKADKTREVWTQVADQPSMYRRTRLDEPGESAPEVMPLSPRILAMRQELQSLISAANNGRSRARN